MLFLSAKRRNPTYCLGSLGCVVFWRRVLETLWLLSKECIYINIANKNDRNNVLKQSLAPRNSAVLLALPERCSKPSWYL